MFLNSVDAVSAAIIWAGVASNSSTILGKLWSIQSPLWPTADSAIKAHFRRHVSTCQGSATMAVGSAACPFGQGLARTVAMLAHSPGTMASPTWM